GGLMKVTPDRVVEILEANNYVVSERKRLGNDTGDQIRTACGRVINVYDKGTWNVQGREPHAIRALLEASLSGQDASARASTLRTVFVVYGHDTTARDQLEAMLRRWGLEPLLLDQLPSEGQTLIEKLEYYRGKAGYAVVLAT